MMSKEFTQNNAIKALEDANKIVERIGEETGIWQIDFYTPNGKWKYSDYVQMTKPDRWVDFDVLINRALRDTPKMFRITSIVNLASYWTAVMVNNPLGFPIMVVGHES